MFFCNLADVAESVAPELDLPATVEAVCHLWTQPRNQLLGHIYIHGWHQLTEAYDLSYLQSFKY